MPSAFLASQNVTDPYEIFESLDRKHVIILKEQYPEYLVNIQSDIMLTQLNYLLNHQSSSIYVSNLNKIKKHYTDALNEGIRVFAMSHSQGGLFMEDAYQLLDYPKKHKYFSGFQIATPISSSLIPKHEYATHDKDRVINLVRENAGAYAPNIVAPFLVFNSEISDFFLNHGITSTYLFDQDIATQVIQRMIASGQALDTNCAQAFIEYSAKKLTVTFDSSYPDGNDLEDVIYEWDFGDGSPIVRTSSKEIEHNYQSSGTYTVSLRVTDVDDSSLGPLSISKEEVIVTDEEFCDGANGSRHLNIDGSMGGFVAETAYVDPLSYIGPNIEVCGNSRITGQTHIDPGNSDSFRIENSTLNDVSISINLYSTGYFSLISESDIDKVQIQYADSAYLINSTVTDSSFMYSTGIIDSHVLKTNSTYHTYITNSTFENVNALGAWVDKSQIRNSTFDFWSEQSNGSIIGSIIDNTYISIKGRAFRIYESSVIDSRIVYTNANFIYNYRGYFYSTLRGFDVVVDEFYTSGDQMNIIFPTGESYSGPISGFLQ